MSANPEEPVGLEEKNPPTLMNTRGGGKMPLKEEYQTVTISTVGFASN